MRKILHEGQTQKVADKKTTPTRDAGGSRRDPKRKEAENQYLPTELAPNSFVSTNAKSTLPSK